MSLLKRLFGSTSGSADAGRVSVDESAGLSKAGATAALGQWISQDTKAIAIEASAKIAAGRYGEALALLDATLALSPDDAVLWLARGNALFAWGRAWEAQGSYIHAEAKGGRVGELYLQLGLALLQTGRSKEAEPWLLKALAAGAPWSETHCALATSLTGQKRLDDAMRHLETALRERPDDYGCCLALGNCLIEKADYAGAEGPFRRAVAVAETSAVAWVHLGVALDRQGRVVEALQAFERATQFEGVEDRDVDIFVDKSITLHNLGRKRETIALCERNLAQRPSARGYFTYATSLLADGRLEEAWQYFEFRWLAEPQLTLRPQFGRVVWTGQDLSGKTILLHVEQGMGDVIQYVRYARMVKALGATVFLVTGKALGRIMHRVPGVDRLLGPGEASPDFDYYVHLLSLPKIFGTGLDSIPAEIPYLFADPERRREAQNEVARESGQCLKVGLVWSGSAANAYNLRRACPLEVLAPLFKVPGVRWFSLQRSGESLATGDADADVPLKLLELRNDMAGTAALVDALDLVLSVDTSIAHLAGALGKPVWLLLPKVPHWTWLDDRDDSPWYPTMRLFRQRELGAWAVVVAQVKEALDELLRKGGAAALPRPPVLSTDAVRPVRQPVSQPGPGPGHRSGLGAAAETRHGILQFLPDAGDEGLALGWYGEWLQAQLDVLAQLLRDGSTVLEVGAGIGAHALWLGKSLGDEGHLMLCEPRPVPQRILRQNIAANRVANASLLQGALGGPNGDGESVDSLRLPGLDWLKVDSGPDVQAVLAGAANTLWRLRPSLWLAAADAADSGRIAQAAKAYGYRCWRHEAALFDPRNFNRRTRDIFDGRTALALLALPEEADVKVAFGDCVEL